VIGQTLSHYRIIEELGRGGMGVVYKAEDIRLHRFVALKFLTGQITASEEDRLRFLTEARAAAALNHPNIAQVYTVEEAGDRTFIVMELVDGLELKKKISEGALPSEEVLRITRQISAGLQTAHDRGVVHRDIKSSNIMLTEAGQVKIMDFGLARVEGIAQVTKIGTTVGTAAYMSPEQARGDDVDHRTDIWSMGVVVYEMLAGRVPFRSDYEQAVIYSVLNEEPEDLNAIRPEIGKPVSDVMKKVLAKEPDSRYASAAAFQQALEHAVAGQDSADSAQSAPKRHGKRKISWPLRVVPVVLLAVAAFLFLRGHETFDSLAILPFENVGGDENTEYLSDGITESLISTLSGVHELRVMSRSSVFRFKSDLADPQGIGKRLGVSAVLSGRVQVREQDLTISAELIDVSDNSQLWGAQYTRPSTDILELQEEITQEISQGLRLRLGDQDAAKAAYQGTRNTDAYGFYLKGRYFWNKRTEEGARRSIEYFNRAVETDPAYSRAYAGLADAYIILGGYNAVPPWDAFPAARSAAEKALAIDPGLAEAHASLGDIEIHYGWDWGKADSEFRLAIAHDPTYATAYQWYGEYLSAVGRHQEAIAMAKRGRELDPLSPIIGAYVGLTLHMARDLNPAKAEFERTIEMMPEFPWARAYYGLCLGQLGMKDEMVRELELARSLYGHPMILGYLGYAYGVAGKRAEAEEILSTLVRSAGERYISPYYIAVVQLGLGRREEALSWLERSEQDHSPTLFMIGVHPLWDPLRDEPRFKAVVEKVGLTAALPRDRWAKK